MPPQCSQDLVTLTLKTIELRHMGSLSRKAASDHCNTTHSKRCFPLGSALFTQTRHFQLPLVWNRVSIFTTFLEQGSKIVPFSLEQGQVLGHLASHPHTKLVEVQISSLGGLKNNKTYQFSGCFEKISKGNRIYLNLRSELACLDCQGVSCKF